MTDRERTLARLQTLNPLLDEEQIIDTAIEILQQLQEVMIKGKRRVGIVPLDMDGDILQDQAPVEITIPT